MRTVAKPVSRIQDALARDLNSYFFLVSCTGIDTCKHEWLGKEFSDVKCLLIFISCQQIYCEAVNNDGLPREPYQFKVAYDKLVIASGSEPLTFGISKEEKKCLLHCVVIRGGPTRVEFSGELSDFIMRHVQEHYIHVKDYIHVTLIEANEILSCFNLRVRLMWGVVKMVHLKKIILSEGKKVPYGLLVWSTGVDLPKSQGGIIGVDDWLHVPSMEDAFSLGDCAGFLEHIGRLVLLALAQVL
ncbi:Internal alternative NAD(P)H-ubiquinone oxidoreductase A1, mitochondrial [Glycine soja]